jgi:hypothetical protein
MYVHLQVKQLLQSAQDMDALLTELPGLLDPNLLISVLVTVDKWYFNKKDPVAVIEADPDLIRRAQVRGRHQYLQGRTAFVS